jgi:serine/threonine protein kinase
MPDGRSRYELRSRIGRGAHGSVYLAADHHLSDDGRPAYTAIKILARGADHARAASVREEAARARRVDHPNIVRVLDRGVDDDGQGYIVYEFVDGPSLREWLARRPTPPSHVQCAALMVQVAHGVQAAHTAGVVHCDLKPDNILMAPLAPDAAGERQAACGVTPKVADFGLAVCLENARISAQRSAAGIHSASGGAAIWGSLGFVAPEQYRGEEGALAPPADVYALGGILYFLLTGRIPNGQSPGEVKRNLQLVDGEEPHDRRALRFDNTIDPDLEAICRRALSMGVKERYASAEAFMADLEHWGRREPLRWFKPTPMRRARLFALRNPYVVLAFVAALCLTSVAGAIAASWRANAAHRLHLAKLEGDNRLKQERFEAARKLEESTSAWYEQTRLMMQTAVENLNPSRGSSISENWLANLTILESLFGRGLLLPDDSGWWPRRIEHVGAMVNGARAGGREPDVLTLFWESGLGYWVLLDGPPAEARNILNRNRRSWSTRTSPDDPWLAQLELLEACAITRAILARPRGGEEEGTRSAVALGSIPELQEAVRTLERENLVFIGTAEGGPAHRTVLRLLYQVYSPGYLNDPLRQREIQQRLQGYLN